MPHTTLPHRGTVPALTEPVVLEGTCPSRSCAAVYPLTPAGQIPDHPRANQWHRPRPGRCPCSGWLARDPHPAPRFYVEGVQWL